MSNITPPNTKASNPREEHLRALKEKTAKVIDGVYASLVNEDAYGRLPEYIFVDRFLPYFTGEKSLTEDDNVIATWVSIAGSPSNSVKILDESMNVIFTAPPLFNTDVLDTLADREVSLSTIYHNYILRKNNLPIMGERFLDNAINDKAEKIIHNIVNVKNEKAWQEIFERYGKIKKTQIKQDESLLDEDYFDFS